MLNKLKTYWKHLAVILGLGVAVAFAAAPSPSLGTKTATGTATTTPTVITVNSRNITGDFFSPSTVIPTVQSVTVQATMTDAVWHDPTASFVINLQYSTDGGTTWRDASPCGWQGRATDFTAPDGTLNPRPYCKTDILNLSGAKGRLHIFAPQTITMGGTITFQ